MLDIKLDSIWKVMYWTHLDIFITVTETPTSFFIVSGFDLDSFTV